MQLPSSVLLLVAGLMGIFIAGVHTEIAGAGAAVCQQPMESGVCYARFLRFYYNPAAGDCERFTYGGCGGNENNFRTLDDCRSACKK